MPSNTPRLMSLLLALGGASSAASEPAVSQRLSSGRPTEERNYFNFRVGAQATTGSGQPQLCLELSPWAVLGVEACGTGAGILHDEPGVEMSHYRGKLRLHSWTTKLGALEPRAHLGFAEIQVGEDVPGFHFGSTGPRGVETAGLETGLSLRLLKNIASGFDLVGEIALDLAHLPQAPRLAKPMSALQPSVSFTVGAGF